MAETVPTITSLAMAALADERAQAISRAQRALEVFLGVEDINPVLDVVEYDPDFKFVVYKDAEETYLTVDASGKVHWTAKQDGRWTDLEQDLPDVAALGAAMVKRKAV